MSDDEARELKAETTTRIAAPELSYKPPVPGKTPAPIALIGCGGIAHNHLDAYKNKGYPVTVLCDIRREAAEALRDEFFPDAEVSDDADAVLVAADQITVIITNARY